MDIQAQNETNNSEFVRIDKHPDECSVCHNKVTPILSTAFLDNNKKHNNGLQLVFRCPAHDCRDIFIGYYSYSGGTFYFRNAKPSNTIPIKFSNIISGVSSDFIKIYNQAYMAEQLGLDVICGAGYRKALEFLIKDYLIEQNTVDTEKIKKEFLGNTIEIRVNHTNLKSVAKRAVWLGNDESHYERKWVGKDINDLKNLIDLTIRWIETNKLTDQLMEDMPEAKEA